MPQHPYNEFLDAVARPARYVAGEYMARPTVEEDGALHVAFGFPDVYEVGMSHQGLQILLSVLDMLPSVRRDRIFTPWPDMEKELRARELPLVTLDHATPLGDVDVIGLSLQHELNATNVLTLLDLGAIPIRSADRADSDPIVLGGGPWSTHAEAVAPFFDLFVVGEAEEVLAPLLASIQELRAAGTPRRELLSTLATRHAGVWVPGLHNRVAVPLTGFVTPRPTDALPWPVARQVADLDKTPFPADGPVATAEAVFDRVAVEVARGCQQGCRFCQAGMLYRPARERSAGDVARCILEGVRCGGYEEASLSSLSTADWGPLAEAMPTLMDTLQPRRVSLSVSSLRAYGLDDRVLEAIARVRKTGLTLAPEAGSERLRRVINKNVTDEQLIGAVRRAAARGWKRVKLYFMIGLPTETDDDVRAIADLAVKVRSATGRRPLAVTVSVSNHVPKPHCPFQWEAMDAPDELRRKQALLRDELRRRRLSLKSHDANMSRLETVMARGDARIADVIEAAWRSGARFDSWDEHHRPELWTQAFEQLGVDPDLYCQEIPVDAPLPWDYAHIGPRKAFLAAERRKAYAASPSLACGIHDPEPSPEGAGRCYRCGADCNLDWRRPSADEQRAQIETAVAEVDLPPPALDKDEERVRWRFRYRKIDSLRTLGHLELIGHVVRTVRRAGIRIAYSAGFNPHPQVTFPPPLPVGAVGLAEHVDVLAGPLEQDDAAVLGRLNAVSPRGLEWYAVTRLPAMSPKLTRQSQLADHAVALRRADVAKALGLDDAGDPGALETALESRLAEWAATPDPIEVPVPAPETAGEPENDGEAPEPVEPKYPPLEVIRMRKGEAVVVDVRPALRHISLTPAARPEGHAAADDRLEHGSDELLVHVRLTLHGQGSNARPTECLKAALPDYDGPMRWFRVAIWGQSEDATPTDLLG